MLQTLTRMENLEEIAESYTQIIIDEAHHIPATSFEGVMKMLPARYVVGLTATPYRKDGLQKIIFQQCGPVRHTITSRDGWGAQKKSYSPRNEIQIEQFNRDGSGVSRLELPRQYRTS
jgi:superfamily II DNA or RNA helicase